MLHSTHLNQLFKLNKNFIMSHENVHPAFKGILDNLSNMYTTTEKDEKEGMDLHLTAIKSHNKNFLTFQYPFLHMTGENEATYELGFMAGVMYATGEQLKLMEKQPGKDKIQVSEENEKTLLY